MSTAKNPGTAQAAKDKGNVAFKTGDFPVAIGHYTTAILADRNDYTLPLNRAAAYLKLGKNEDAERDCTAVLSLSPSNVKALYRRGQARQALGKLHDARNDLLKALQSEPTNKIVQEELKKVNNLLGKIKTELPDIVTSVPMAPKRRRVPITIVDPPTPIPPNSHLTPLTINSISNPISKILPPAKPATEILQPVSSRSLKSQPPLSSSPPLPTAKLPPSTKLDETRTFKGARQARESAKPSRVGGGIFRASGDNIIFPIRAESSPKPIVTDPLPRTTRIDTRANETEGMSPSLTNSIPRTSMSLFEFSKSWRSTSAIKDRWALITTISPADLPVLFKSSLEPTLLVDILQVFEALVGDEQQRPLLQEYMENFSRVPRFGTVALFLSRKEKDTVERVWERLGIKKDAIDPIWGTYF